MITMLENWKGSVEVNGTEYNSIADVDISANFQENAPFHIKLYSSKKNRKNTANLERPADVTEYRVHVKKWMTQNGFDFMQKWNNDVPMPLRVMIGGIDRETPGMYHMTLHGDVYAEKICTCMKCGKRLTNPVSQYFGIGPECGGHNYVHPFNTDEELQQAVVQYRKQLQATTWTGWVAKSAIEKMEEVE